MTRLQCITQKTAHNLNSMTVWMRTGVLTAQHWTLVRRVLSLSTGQIQAHSPLLTDRHSHLLQGQNIGNVENSAPTRYGSGPMWSGRCPLPTTIILQLRHQYLPWKRQAYRSSGTTHHAIRVHSRNTITCSDHQDMLHAVASANHSKPVWGSHVFKTEYFLLQVLLVTLLTEKLFMCCFSWLGTQHQSIYQQLHSGWNLPVRKTQHWRIIHT